MDGSYVRFRREGVILMIAVSVVALIGDRRSASKRRRAPAPQAAAAE